MKTAYLDYSMSVIGGRALPDVRDAEAGASQDPVRDVPRSLLHNKKVLEERRRR